MVGVGAPLLRWQWQALASPNKGLVMASPYHSWYFLTIAVSEGFILSFFKPHNAPFFQSYVIERDEGSYHSLRVREDHLKTNCSGTNEDWPVDRVSAGTSNKAELSHITPVYFSGIAVSSCSPHLPEKGDSAEEWMKCLCIVRLHHCVFCISIIEVPLDFSSTQWAGGPIFFPWKATWLPSLDSRPITTSDTGLFCKRECWMTHNESQACKQTHVHRCYHVLVQT